MSELVRIASGVVSAYVSHNSVPSADLAGLIETVYGQLDAIQKPRPGVSKPEPAVSIKKSVHPDHIVCLICGGKFRSMKRHLLAQHEMTPADYQAQFDLPADYPMVPASYSKKRSEIAKAIDLGSRGLSARPKTEAA